MFQSQKAFSLSGIILLIVLLLNGVILKEAYTDNQNLYWALLISIPLLAIAVYYAKYKKYVMLPDNTIKDILVGSGYVRSKPANPAKYKSKIGTTNLTVLIGNDQCARPYSSGILSIGYCTGNRNNSSTLNGMKLSEMFAFPQGLDESENGSIDLNKPDVILQITADDPGGRNKNGNFNFDLFTENASSSEVKMIVLNLSQAASLTGKKNAKASPAIEPGYMEPIFFNAEGMVLFLDKLRQLSGKKPVGINIRISNKKEFYEICYAIRKTKIIPDFIIVEGFGNGDTGQPEHKGHTGMHLYDELLFVSKTLESYGLNKKIKIIASANIRSGFEVLKLFALGANAICVQFAPFQINEFEIGNSIQSNSLTHTLSSLHCELTRNTIAMMKTCGYKNMNDITLSSFFRCMDIFESQFSEEIHHSDSKIISIEKGDRNLKSYERPSKMAGKAEPIRKQITM